MGAVSRRSARLRRGCGAVTPSGSPPVPPTVDAGLPPQSCQAGSSLSILITGSNVTAYVPKGNWNGATTGVVAVPIEGTSVPAPVTIDTDQVVNSCSSDSTLGQVVCIGNNLGPSHGEDVYVLSGTTNTITSTLSSAATTTESFSGGQCDTCAQAIDPLHNMAYLSIGTAGGAAFQPLNLATGALGTPISANGALATSENILVDPIRNLVLSPNEDGSSDGDADYQLLNVSTGAVFDFFLPNAGHFDSAGEDCSTGIAIATIEEQSALFLTNLTQATFSGTAWSAPSSVQAIPEFSVLKNGTCGIAVAPNSHLGVVIGELGGNTFGAIQLPATSGSGTPALVNWLAATVPDDPSGNPYANTIEPHPVGAYASPATGKQYAVLPDYDGTLPSFLVIINLQALMALPRSSPGAHTLAAPLAIGTVVRYISL